MAIETGNLKISSSLTHRLSRMYSFIVNNGIFCGNIQIHIKHPKNHSVRISPSASTSYFLI